ncbi:MAG TPA: MetS family NSS transporter small subunit [Acidobacteriota bacterium]|nr:MetS family NSS transporter small subunit [Acidobacteriota bacterium]
MNSLSLLTMIVILSVVWGGFIFCLTLALRKERRKDRS